MSLYQLVYISDRSAAMEDAELQAIIDRSSITNSEKGITGLLLFAGGHFMQLLEGELIAINPLFKKIAKDPRHTNVRRLLEQPAESRLFPDWGMKLADSRNMPLNQQRIDKLLIQVRLGSDQEQAAAALKLLEEFKAQLMPRAA